MPVRQPQATSRISERAGSLEKISFGAVLDVRKDGRKVATLRPEKGYYPSMDAVGLGPIGRFFEGESTSEVGMKAGLTRDLWTAMSPDVGKLRPVIDQVFPLKEAAAAHRHMEERKNFGKIVLRV